MKKTHYLTVTVQEGNRLEISTPTLPVGQIIEVILIISENQSTNLNSVDRQAFMQLPIEERQRILKEQSEGMEKYYQEDSQWQEWVNLDIGNIHDYESETR